MAHLFKRGRTFYLKYYIGGKQKELSLRTASVQIAKEKKRQFESAVARGDDGFLPTRTPIPQILQRYVEHIWAIKTPKSAQTEVYYLRETFGPACEALKITSRTASTKGRKRPSANLTDGRKKLPVVWAGSLEEITSAEIAAFIDFKVRDQGIMPKTANHYRSILRRVFNWAVERQNVRLPNNVNPAAKVRPYRERASQISFMTLAQVEEQLHALRFKPQLQTMVAVLIYAGLRREELLWLTLDDVDLSRRASGGGGAGMIRVRAKTVNGQFWQPNTKGNRAVPISKTLREYLNCYTPPASDATSEGSGGGWFFPSPEGRLWDTDNFSRALRAANREAGLSWGCLDFRHTFGSQLAQKGVSLYKIATLMGNSPEICRRHYAALIPEAMTGDVEFHTAARPASILKADPCI